MFRKTADTPRLELNHRAELRRRNSVALPRSWRIQDTAKADRPSAIAPGRHQEELLMFVEPIRLGKIPNRSMRLIERTTAHNRRACVFVPKLVGPLRNVSDHVERTKRTSPFGKCIHVGGRAHHSPVVRRRKRLIFPFVSPRIKPTVGTLRRILPFP